jgi:hypothetical protein
VPIVFPVAAEPGWDRTWIDRDELPAGLAQTLLVVTLGGRLGRGVLHILMSRRPIGRSARLGEGLHASGYGRFCCKMILLIWARKIDSITGANAQC